MSNDIQRVEAKVLTIANGSIEQVADALITLDGMAQRIKQLQADAMAAIEERIRESGEFQVGEYLYTLSKPRKVKCRDATAPMKTLLEVTGGDLDKIVSCLSSGAWKHGTVKRVLDECGAPGETWDVLFDVAYEEEVKVTKVNLAFVK
jgi:hypothetical protein